MYKRQGLRGAITFAIDREQLVGQTLGGFAVASTLPCSPNSRYYDVKLANSFAYDTGSYYDQLASASVEDATGDGILDLYVPSKGYSVPVEGTMIVCSSSYIRVQAANEVARMLNSLGFNITVDVYKRQLPGRRCAGNACVRRWSANCGHIWKSRPRRIWPRA